MNDQELNEIRQSVIDYDNYGLDHRQSRSYVKGLRALLTHTDQQAARITALEQQNAVKEAALLKAHGCIVGLCAGLVDIQQANKTLIVIEHLVLPDDSEGEG